MDLFWPAVRGPPNRLIKVSASGQEQPTDPIEQDLPLLHVPLCAMTIARTSSRCYRCQQAIDDVDWGKFSQMRKSFDIQESFASTYTFLVIEFVRATKILKISGLLSKVSLAR
jgi:hypothetical protein